MLMGVVLNGTKSCKFRQNALLWKPGIISWICMMCWDKGWPFHVLWAWNWLGYFSNFYLCMLPASVQSEPENNDNKLKPPLDPFPFDQTSIQDPTSDKSRGGGGFRNPPPLWIRTCIYSIIHHIYLSFMNPWRAVLLGFVALLYRINY